LIRFGIFNMKSLKLLFLLSLVTSLQVSIVFSQNLFDSLNTLRYADYLYGAANFTEAIGEYERYVFLFDASDNEYLRLVRSYRKSGNPDKAYDRLLGIWEKPALVSPMVSKEYYGLKIITNRNENFLNDLALDDKLNEQDKVFLASTYLLLDLKIDQAREMLSVADRSGMNPLADLLNVTEEVSDFKFKSPVVSGLLSTILPGAGKFYTGSVGDGIISLAMIGSLAWQAYRGFDKNGVESASGWIFGSIGAGFYIGNIWGSAKAANKYNYQQKDKIQVRVKSIFNSNL
jgi:tetratricopeptide (TPR) repeat protein